jgi:hypothetical protein
MPKVDTLTPDRPSRPPAGVPGVPGVPGDPPAPYCHRCGAALSPDDRHCPNCGAARTGLRPSGSPGPLLPPGSDPGPAGTAATGCLGVPGCSMWLIFALVLLVVAIGLMFVAGPG